MNDTELQARVREALERTDIMALSTIDEDGGPWTSPGRPDRAPPWHASPRGVTEVVRTHPW
jgi:hypothetical protein